MEPVDLADPSWTTRQGQVVWCPKSGEPDVAGAVIVARSPVHGDFVRFSKGPVEIVVGRRNAEGWQLDVSAFEKSFSGRGDPPDRVGWFHLVEASFLEPKVEPWTWHISGKQEWVLENVRTGERFEGFYRQ